MAVEFTSANVSEIPEIISCLASVGLKVDPRYLKSFFFDVVPSGFHLPVKGGLVVRDEGRIVGFQGLSPCRLWQGRECTDGYILGVLGMRPEYGACMFELIDRVKQDLDGGFLIANTANAKSVKLWTQYGGCVSGPLGGACIHDGVLPVGLLTFPQRGKPKTFDQITTNDLVGFWSLCLEQCKGVLLDRTPERLRNLFSLHQSRGNASLIVCRRGESVTGYAIIRGRRLTKTPYIRFEIIDLIAWTEDDIRHLFKSCRHFATMHGGVLLEYIGAVAQVEKLIDEFLPKKRKALANTAFWYTPDERLQNAFAQNQGWLFGPYEGDRCM